MAEFAGYNSGDSSELVTTIPVTAAGTPTVVFSRPIGDIAAGDIIDACCTMQVTNEMNPNVWVEVYSKIVLAASAGAVSGVDLCPFRGRGIERVGSTHHDVHCIATSHEATAALASARVNLVMKAVGPAGNVIDVDQDYGQISALVSKP